MSELSFPAILLETFACAFYVRNAAATVNNNSAHGATQWLKTGRENNGLARAENREPNGGKRGKRA